MMTRWSSKSFLESFTEFHSALWERGLEGKWAESLDDGRSTSNKLSCRHSTTLSRKVTDDQCLLSQLKQARNYPPSVHLMFPTDEHIS
jgi:hypothetical protein